MSFVDIATSQCRKVIFYPWFLCQTPTANGVHLAAGSVHPKFIPGVFLENNFLFLIPKLRWAFGTMQYIFSAWNIIHDLSFFPEHLTWEEHSMCSFQSASSHSLMLVLAPDLSPIITRLQQLFTFSFSSFPLFCGFFFFTFKKDTGNSPFSSFSHKLYNPVYTQTKTKGARKLTLSNQNFNILQKCMWTVAVVLKLFFKFIHMSNSCPI